MAAHGDKEPFVTDDTALADTAVSEPPALDDTEVSAPVALADTVTPEAGGTARPADRLVPGSHLGRYEILSMLGEGGMGVVYAARDPDLDRKVALKVLRHEHRGEDARARLLREARAMAKLSHPNVITVYEVGSEGDIDYIAMELVDGRDLQSWLAEDRKVEQIVAVFIACGRGLAAAHAAGLVHRDFKPGNVLVGEGDKVVVTDFGLARSGTTIDPPEKAPAKPPAKAAESLMTLTRTGAVVGTPAYMSPEQHQGDPTDARSDQFSFCAALYEALYKKRPFAGNTVEALGVAKLEGKIAPITDRCSVPSHIRRAVLRGLSPDPARRFASMEQLVTALSRNPVKIGAQVAAVVGAFAVVVAAVSYAAILEHRDTGAAAIAAVCEGKNEIDAVWNDDAKAQLRAAFSGGGEMGAAVSTSVVRIVDGYAAAWRQTYESACEGALLTRSIPESDFLLARSCLAQSKAALAALLQALAEGDMRAIESAVASAQKLPSPTGCGNFEALRQGISPPDPASRAKVEALRAKLAAIDALGMANKIDEGATRAEAAAANARSIGYQPAVAEALVTQATALGRARRAGEAFAAIDEAIVVAEETDYESLRARALATKLSLLTRFTNDYPAILQLGRRARAAVKHDASDPLIAVDLNLSLASVYHDLYQYDRSAKLATEALRTLRDATGEQPDTRVARALVLLAEVRAHQGDFAEALALRREGFAVYRELLGDDHPVTRRVAYLLAMSLRGEGRFDAARKLEEALFAADWAQTGHVVRGQVHDARGEPVAGARVVLSVSVPWADTKNVSVISSEDAGAAVGTTDASGRFELPAPADRDLYVIAETESGRSRALTIPAGQAELRHPLELVAFGRLRVRVTVGGQAPARRFQVLLQSSGRHIVAMTSAAGEIAIDRVPAGRYVVFILELNGDERIGRANAETRIKASATAELAFDIDSEQVQLEIAVAGEGGAVIPTAIVNLLPVKLEAKTLAEYRKKVRARDLPDLASIGGGWAMPGRAVRFPNLRPGLYTACIAPFATWRKHPSFAEQYQERSPRDIPVHCREVNVTEAPASQRVTITVPPAPPAPAKAATADHGSSPRRARDSAR